MIVTFSIADTAYGIDLSKEAYLRIPLLFNQNVSSDKEERVKEAKKRGRLKKAVVTAGALTFAIPLIGYLGVKYGHDVSIEHLFRAPDPQPIVEFQDGRNEKLVFNTESFAGPERLKTQVSIALKLQMADQKFWSEIFMNYPNDTPVSGIVTLDLIRKAWKNKQLDDLFNALRLTRPDLVYRYLSEIPYKDMDEFSRYFAVLKPGIRQQIFAIFYKQLKEDFLVLENAKTVKSALYPNSYAALSEQAQRMRVLYSQMAQMLNRIHSIRPGEVPEGPLIIEGLPENSNAPLSMVTFTRAQSEEDAYGMFLSAINKYKNRGYRIILPMPENINVSRLAALIGYYYSSGGGWQSFFEKNHSAVLLQWVLEKTNPNNPRGHRVTEQELLEKAMELNVNTKDMTLNLMGAVADVGHYYKGIARSPLLILGAPEIRAISDGTDFVWNHHDPLSLMWALDAKTVDDCGRPVIFWRKVDSEGNDRIPPEQYTGILRYATEDDSYHRWNIFLTSFYVEAKSMEEIKGDIMQERKVLGMLVKKNPASSIRILSDGVVALFKRDKFNNEAIIDLPLMLKYVRNFGIEEPLWGFQDFGKHTGGSAERAKAVFSNTARKLYKRTSMPDRLIKFEDIPVSLISPPSKRTIEGGQSLESYAKQIIQEWKELSRSPEGRFVRLWQLAHACEQIQRMGIDVPITVQQFEETATDEMLIGVDTRLIYSFSKADKIELILHNETSKKLIEILLDDKQEIIRKYAIDKIVRSSINLPYFEHPRSDDYVSLMKVGEHTEKIFIAWRHKYPKQNVPQELYRTLFNASGLIRKILEKLPDKEWNFVPITGNILEDINALVRAMEATLKSKPESGVRLEEPYGTELEQKVEHLQLNSRSSLFSCI